MELSPASRAVDTAFDKAGLKEASKEKHRPKASNRPVPPSCTAARDVQPL
jgi:hypothetical protein